MYLLHMENTPCSYHATGRVTGKGVMQGSVIIGFCLMYIAMQTFAVPGTLSLSILSGALYGVPKGLLLVSGAVSRHARNSVSYSQSLLRWLMVQ